MMQKNDGLNAQQRYVKKRLYPIQFRFNRNTDADIIGWLERQENKQGKLKQLIREEIAREDTQGGDGEK